MGGIGALNISNYEMGVEYPDIPLFTYWTDWNCDWYSITVDWGDGQSGYSRNDVFFTTDPNKRVYYAVNGKYSFWADHVYSVIRPVSVTITGVLHSVGSSGGNVTFTSILPAAVWPRQPVNKITTPFQQVAGGVEITVSVVLNAGAPSSNTRVVLTAHLLNTDGTEGLSVPLPAYSPSLTYSAVDVIHPANVASYVIKTPMVEADARLRIRAVTSGQAHTVDVLLTPQVSPRMNSTDMALLVPNPDDLLGLPIDEQGPLVLKLLTSARGSSTNELTGLAHSGWVTRRNFFCVQNSMGPPKYGTRQKEVDETLSEAWNWLVSQGLLAKDPSPGQDWFFVTKAGQQLISHENTTSYQKAYLLPRKQLHPVIAEKVYPAFLHGKYDTAIFEAFREIEIAVRQGGGLPHDLVGEKLMRAAFTAADAEKNRPAGHLPIRNCLAVSSPR